MNKKVAIYYRVSTDKQDFKVQEKAIAEFCKKESIAKKVCIEFTDTGYSGKRKSRPEFDRMMRLVRGGRIGAVICYKLDRLARTAMQASRILLELLDEHKVRVCCVTDEMLHNLPPNSPTTPIIVAVMAAVAQIERKQISDRTRAGQLAARKRGVHIGRPKRAVAEEVEVLKLRKKGMSYPKIAKTMKISISKAWYIVKAS